MLDFGFPADQEVPMGQERRSFGSIERRSGYFRARYVGPDRQRYDAPHVFSERIDAEFWLGEVHRSIERRSGVRR
jgi:hypothetical protein